LKTYFKDYFNRIFSQVKKSELIYWWIMRLMMVFALIYTLIVGHGPMGEYEGSNPWQQIVANLVGMFAYEIMQFFPKNSIFRKLSPRFQNITALGFLLGSFGGAFMNFYYIIPMYDKILHATGTAEGVYIGYEFVCAIQFKLKKTCPFQLATLCALGIGFIFASGWELFEFVYDQFFGGDAQHWNVINAIEQAGGNWQDVFLMFPIKSEEVFMQRFSLMDTMSDTVMNFVGGIIMYVVLRFFPYRHRGENDINKQIEEG
jgi:hypothetical protein